MDDWWVEQCGFAAITDICMGQWIAIYNISVVILTQCSTTCGSGNQTRNLYCVTLYGQKVNSAFCVSSLKPVESTKCFNTSSCGQWRTSEWAEVCAPVVLILHSSPLWIVSLSIPWVIVLMQCQVRYCGTGKQIRDVSCVSKSTPEGPHTTHRCLQQERPQVERLCSVPCDTSECVAFLTYVRTFETTLQIHYTILHFFHCVLFLLPHAATPTESPCVDSLSPEHCRLIVQHHCSNPEFAIKCCKSCSEQQQ